LHQFTDDNLVAGRGLERRRAAGRRAVERLEPRGREERRELRGGDEPVQRGGVKGRVRVAVNPVGLFQEALGAERRSPSFRRLAWRRRSRSHGPAGQLAAGTAGSEGPSDGRAQLGMLLKE